MVKFEPLHAHASIRWFDKFKDSDVTWFYEQFGLQRQFQFRRHCRRVQVGDSITEYLSHFQRVHPRSSPGLR